MFLFSQDVPIRLLAVLELSWDQVDGMVSNRPFHALSIRVEGGAEFFQEGFPPTRAEEGEITFAPGGVEFEKRAPRGKILVIHFETPAQLPKQVLHFMPPDRESLLSRFNRLYRVWTRKEAGYALEAKMLFYDILLRIEQAYDRPRDSKLFNACQYIHEHFTDRDISVEKLAQLSSMSDTYFRRLFAREQGVTPLQYINRLRLTRALELLRTDYYSVDQIAEMCGFNNIHYFSYFIKKQTGYSPLACRKRLLEGKNIGAM